MFEQVRDGVFIEFQDYGAVGFRDYNTRRTVFGNFNVAAASSLLPTVAAEASKIIETLRILNTTVARIVETYKNPEDQRRTAVVTVKSLAEPWRALRNAIIEARARHDAEHADLTRISNAETGEAIVIRSETREMVNRMKVSEAFSFLIESGDLSLFEAIFVAPHLVPTLHNSGELWDRLEREFLTLKTAQSVDRGDSDAAATLENPLAKGMTDEEFRRAVDLRISHHYDRAETLKRAEAFLKFLVGMVASGIGDSPIAAFKRLMNRSA